MSSHQLTKFPGNQEIPICLTSSIKPKSRRDLTAQHYHTGLSCPTLSQPSVVYTLPRIHLLLSHGTPTSEFSDWVTGPTSGSRHHFRILRRSLRTVSVTSACNSYRRSTKLLPLLPPFRPMLSSPSSSRPRICAIPSLPSPVRV